MGIRFKCHLCQAPLNVKSNLANKRGVCPQCLGRFRIPDESQEFSLSLDARTAARSNAMESVAANGAAPDSIHPPEAMPLSSPSLQSSSTSHEAIDDKSTNLFFVRPPSGGEYGPAPAETIQAWIVQRRVTAETMICRIGTTQWRRARDVFSGHFES